MSSRTIGLAVAGAGIGASVVMAAVRAMLTGRALTPASPSALDAVLLAIAQVSTVGLLALAGAALMALLFSRHVPRWWSLGYAAAALGLIVATLTFEGAAAAAWVARLRQDPTMLTTGWTPAASDYLSLAPRLVLGVLASVALAAPWLVPPRMMPRAPDAPKQPLGL